MPFVTTNCFKLVSLAQRPENIKLLGSPAMLKQCPSRPPSNILFLYHPVSVHDVLSGAVTLPFTTRSAWLQTQQECPDLRRAHSHLKQGTRPSKKSTNIKDVKRYLNAASLSRDGLVVVRKEEPFPPLANVSSSHALS
jgi:hypothetical protein